MALSLTLYISLALMAVLIVVINLIVSATIILKKKLRTYTNGFILSMSLSDLLFGAVFLPVYLTHPLHNMNGYVTAICLFSNVGNLCSLTTERVLALLRPLHYRVIIGRYFFPMIVLAWIVPILASVLPLAWHDTSSTTIQNVYVGSLIACFIVIPYIYIIVAYALIFQTVRKRQKKFENVINTGSSMKIKSTFRTELRVARLFFIVSLLFAIVWVPSVYMTVCTMVDRLDLIPAELELAGVYMFCLNSIMNSVLYALMKPDLKGFYKQVFHSCCNSRTKNGANNKFITGVCRNAVIETRFARSTHRRGLHSGTPSRKGTLTIQGSGEITKSRCRRENSSNLRENKLLILSSPRHEQHNSSSHVFPRFDSWSHDPTESLLHEGCNGKTVVRQVINCSKDEFTRLRETEL